MRVCIVSSAPFPPREGIGTHIWDLSNYLTSCGIQVDIVTRGSWRDSASEEIDGVRILRPRFYPLYPFHVWVHGFFIQAAVHRLEKYVDIFHLHTPLPPPIKTSRPVILTVHSLMRHDALNRKIKSGTDVLDFLQSNVSYVIERQLAQNSSQIIAVSENTAEQIFKYLPAHQDRVVVIPNGIDTEVYRPSKKVQPRESKLLFVGRLDQQKGLSLLVDSMIMVVDQFPGVELTIVGDGPLKKSIKEKIKEYGLEKNVKLVGKVGTSKRLRLLYQSAWCLLVPSRYETGPRVALEAMACGTPVIASNVGVLPEAIISGGNGIILSRRGKTELSDAICEMLKSSDMRDQFSKTARQRITERFSLERMGSNVIRSYREVLGERI